MCDHWLSSMSLSQLRGAGRTAGERARGSVGESVGERVRAGGVRGRGRRACEVQRRGQGRGAGIEFELVV